MNKDVVQEILLHLPVQTLLRLRAVSKSWRDVIGSPSFRKLHTNNNNNKRVCLQFNFPCNQHHKLCIKLLDNGKSFKLPHTFDEFWPYNQDLTCIGPVKGLICIYSPLFKVPIIAICNPFLGQFKILPKSPLPQCGGEKFHHVGIGIDYHGDYKVVELVLCYEYNHYHARVYSRRMDSWRELAGDGVCDQIRDLTIIKPVKSTSKNGYFAHWMATGVVDWVVLTFDMRNEVFRVTKLSGCCSGPTTEILARDMDGEGEEDSFVVFNFSISVLGKRMVEIHEQGSVLGKRRVEIHEQGRSLRWQWQCKQRKRMVSLRDPLRGKRLWRGRDYVVVKMNVYGRRTQVSLYDYRARASEFAARFELPEGSEIIEYVGSFVSLE